MQENEIDIRFEDAVEKANEMTQASLPQDVQLRLYALYKQATMGTIDRRISPEYDLRNAFKMNAWMQISHFSIEQAKEEYINLINSLV
ncbi:acyl-CoA-binding protein [Flavobacterium sp.]|jgi:acyl-CoA-binding protein|uniref:acyl-CoA-binding protein n=1 Tax=Flavobacterium sp. TaxID=239 RepID=UPI0037514433